MRSPVSFAIVAARVKAYAAVPTLVLRLRITNEDRAMMYYAEDERLRKMKDLMDLAALPIKAGDSTSNDKLRREIQKAFMRD